MQEYIDPSEISDLSPSAEEAPRVYRRTKEIKKLANVFGFTLLSQQFIAALADFAAAFAYYFITAVLLNRPVFGMFSFTQNNNSVVSVLLTCFVYFSYMFIPFMLQAFILKKAPLSLVPAGRIRQPRYLLPAFSVVMFFTIIAQFATKYILFMFGLIHLEPLSPDFTVPGNPPALAAFFFEICILAPVCEEFIFRGLIIQALRRYGLLFAVTVSSILFAMVHGNVVQMPLAFILGMIFGALVIEFGSIWVTIIMHCAVNTVSLSLDVLANRFGDLAANGIYFVFMLLVLFTAAPILYVCRHKIREKMAAYTQSELPMPFMMKKFFLCPGTIFFIIITLVLSGFYMNIA